MEEDTRRYGLFSTLVLKTHQFQEYFRSTSTIHIYVFFLLFFFCFDFLFTDFYFCYSLI